ncbi:MAG TPA: hypothetical protein VNQ73_14840 [Ilumatobacter sp.]|nr:hypothetical protein [Ilumatobacter sp.]
MTPRWPGDTRPPFEPDNEAATKHGAGSQRKVGPIAEQLRAELAASAPWTMGPAFAAAAAAWASAEAQCRLYRDYADQVGLLDADGTPRPFLAAWSKAESRAERQRARLGLDPAAWAQLHRTMTASPDGTANALDALRATGRQMIEATTAAPAAIEAGEVAGEEVEDLGLF